MPSPLPHTSPDHEFAFSDANFQFIADLTYERTGIVLAINKRDMVYGRLVRRLRSLKLPSFDAYCALLKSDQGSEELGPLVNAITTNLTHFFREPHHFDYLRELIHAQPPKDRRLRIWSAGCSSGMEPYSIAMTLLDAIPNIASWDARILATDIDSGMLETGRKGTYTAAEYDNIPPPYRSHVHTSGETLQILETPRQLITFNYLNLLEDWPMRGPFNAIFCRNVMIYFDTPTKHTLISRFAELLSPNGLLFIGHSENMPAGIPGLVSAGRTAYRRAA